MAAIAPTRADALAAALDAAGRGWHVFPLAAKVPFNGSHGHLDAIADPTAVRAAMNDRRAISYGVRTGAPSGLIVVDVDDLDALASLEADLGPLPNAPTVITASGGEHRYFAHPGGHVPSPVGKLAPGIDIRADGSFGVGAGSTLPDGRRYGWEASSHPDEVPLVALPPAWLAAIRATPARPAAATDDAEPITHPGRNHALTRIAGHLRRAGLSEAAMRAALIETNIERCRPPLPDADVARIAASVARYPAGQLPPLPALPPPAATADPCDATRDALAAARAELAAERAERVALADQVATLQERARAQDVTIAILTNPDIGPAAVTAVALVDRLRSRRPDRPDHDASHRVPHAALAARTGRSIDATADHVRRLAALTDPDGAPLFARDVISVPERVDSETGEIVALHREQYIGTGPVTAEHLAAALAVYAAPTKRNHGGQRTANPPCPRCGSRHRRTVCGGCGATVNPAAPTVDAAAPPVNPAAPEPNRQDARTLTTGPNGPPRDTVLEPNRHLAGLAPDGPRADQPVGPLTLFRQDASLAPDAATDTDPGPLEAAVRRTGPLPSHGAPPPSEQLAPTAPAEPAWMADAPAVPEPSVHEFRPAADHAGDPQPTTPPSEQLAPSVGEAHALRVAPGPFDARGPAHYDKYTDLANGRP